jgi:predicted metal-binding membrane protein
MTRPRNPIAVWITEHPAWWVLAVSGVAWVAMLDGGHAANGWALCASAPGLGNVLDASGGLLFGWVIMTLAMMPPLSLPMLRHIAVRSFPDRRQRAMVVFLAGTLAVWALAGVMVVPLMVVRSSWMIDQTLVPVAAFLIAAAWQLTPWKQAALRRCHRTFPLAPAGWAADRDCLRFGLAHGLDCVVACWPAMLALMLAQHGLAIGICVQCIAMAERRRCRYQPVTTAAGLVLCGVLALGGQLLGGGVV